YSPDGRLLANSDGNGVQFRDALTAEVKQSWRANAPGVNHLAFSPDGTRLAVACQDRSIRLLETATGKEVSKLSWSAGFFGIALNPPQVIHVAWSPDGTRLAGAAAVPNPV